ncbi:hypothetical protein OQA88_598 [Cercophora sp. LCS_1]
MASSKPAVNLETELTCSICSDLLYNPLTLLDCLHTFCGACVKEWFSFQATRAENAPLPPAPDAAVFTCPSCRERVRDTKHDARVATLLDMFLGLNVDRVRPEREREEMDAKYRKGEKVLPKLKIMERSPEQRRLDEEERRLLEQVQRESLREEMARAERRDRGRRGESRTGRREESRTRRRAQSANLRAEGGAGGEGRRRRSEERARGGEREAVEAVANRAAGQLEHQASLRSLISAEGVGTRDIEREIEEFTRQIQEEGLLDGLDLDDIDLRSNDELHRRVTEAYRRYRGALRPEGRRSTASASSHRSELSVTRPRAHTGDNSRPTSRHGGHSSRPPSANSTDERGRGRYPPSSSTHLEPGEPTRRRRTSSGGSRSATAPLPVTQTEARGITARSQTDLAIRPSASIIAAEARSSSSPTQATPTATGRGDSPDQRNASFNTRAASGLGITQPSPTDAGSDSDTRSRKRTPAPPRPADLTTTQTTSSSPGSPGLASPRRNLPRFKEPFVVCNSCNREHIEYELHYNCAICASGDWNLCLDCWRRRKGCLHWLGFGKTAWDRWEKLRAQGDPKWVSAPPHFLTANRYLPPKITPGGAEGRRTLTHEDPMERLQSGTFCSRCAAWTNDGYWRCDTCNEGEWGFCGNCVGKGMACTHLLLPMAYTDAGTTPPASPGETRPAQGQKAFRPISVPKPCSSCRRRIPAADARYHCYSCVSDAVPDAGEGSYDICRLCYAGLVAAGQIPPENGPVGWRRCPKAGHRMVLEVFDVDGRGAEKKRILQDLAGGRRLTRDKVEGREGFEVWGWKDGGRKIERLVAVDVGTSAEGVVVPGSENFTKTTFPPDGGTAQKAVAGWGWYPAGAEDELMFPKWAEVLEVEDVNGEWFHGWYMGVSGLLPAPYVKMQKDKTG